MDIYNEEQLKFLLNKICLEVIEKVSDKALNLLKEKIKFNTYLSHGVNKIYPNFSENESEFYNAFEWTEIKSNVNNITRELFYNWQSLSNDKSIYRHASASKNYPQDTREALAGYLNMSVMRKGTNPNHIFSVSRKPFWTLFINRIFDQGKMNLWFEEEFRKYGIVK